MAREMVEYHEQLRKIHPQYDDCPLPCAELDEDMPDFCQECEVRAQWKEFRESFAEQRARRFRSEEISWGFDALYADVAETMALKGNRAQRGHSALQERCLSIVRNELHRPRRIWQWEQEQKAKHNPHG